MLSLMSSFVLAAAGALFACTLVAVYDGDGPIWCEEGTRIRLKDIAAREMDNTCRPGHPCPRASGEQARDALVNLLGGPRGTMRTGHVRVRYPTIQCRSHGQNQHREIASCRLTDGRDLSAAMVQTGTVLPWPH
jgi:endonuclease YncB( thermonuclease family)